MCLKCIIGALNWFKGENILNILHIVPLYLPSVGGTEIHTRELSIELAKLGNQVTIFTTDAMYNTEMFPKIGYRTKHLGEAVFSDSNNAVYRFHVTNSLFMGFVTKFLSATCNSLEKLGLHRSDVFDYVDALHNAPCVPKLYFTLIQSTNINVVNSTPFPFGYLLFLKKICKRKRIPFIVTPRAHTMAGLYSQPFLLKTARESDAVIALTEHEKEFFVEKEIPKDKIFVTGIGIHPENYQKGDSVSFKAKYGISQDTKIVLFIGRIDEGKGVGLLLRSMENVWNRIPDVYLVLLGRSTEGTSKIREVARHKRVIILSDATEETKNDALSSSDFLVLPSIYESFGGVFLEAWAAGKPVIGCRTPAISCVIDDMVDGLLVSPKENELAEKILYLLENEAEARRMGEKGKQKVLRKYTWKIIAAKTLRIYEEVSKR